MSHPATGEGANAAPSIEEPDAHGQAALLLAESTLHMLVEKSVIKVTEAVAVIQTAAEVKAEIATQAGESQERMQASLDLLFRISDSFAVDLSSGERQGN